MILRKERSPRLRMVVGAAGMQGCDVGGLAVCTLVAAGKQPIVAWPDLGLHNPASRGRKPTTVPGSAVVLHDSSTTDAHGV